MQPASTRQRYAVLAGAILTTFTIPVVLAQKWLDRNPYVLTMLAVLTALLYLAFVSTGPRFIRSVSKFRQRKPVAVFTLFIVGGALVGICLGLFAWAGVAKNKEHLAELARGEPVQLTTDEIAFAIARRETDSPPKLSPEVAEMFRTAIAAKSGSEINVLIFPNTPESAAYGERFRRAFTDAGWIIRSSGGAQGTGHGVRLFAEDVNAPEVSTVMQALERIDIKYSIYRAPTGAGFTFQVGEQIQND